MFVSGHEHDPSLNVECVDSGCDLMMLAAGATVPPWTSDRYTYTYNILQFDWDEAADGLRVTIFPRAWSDERTEFVPDNHRLGGRNPTVVLGCPNFRRSARPASDILGSCDAAEALGEAPLTAEVAEQMTPETPDDRFAMALLRFFRDLSPTQRLSVLIRLKALPEDWREPLTHGIERRIVDKLAAAGRVHELEKAIDAASTRGGDFQGESK